jgi:hypothetical protein
MLLIERIMKGSTAMKNYFGSKGTSGLYQAIIAMMPPHDTYIETHLGGGAIMRHKPAALHNFAIDLDINALRAFKCEYPVRKITWCAINFSPRISLVDVNWCIAIPYLQYTRTSSRRYRLNIISRDTLICLSCSKGFPVRLCSQVIHPSLR